MTLENRGRDKQKERYYKEKQENSDKKTGEAVDKLINGIFKNRDLNTKKMKNPQEGEKEEKESFVVQETDPENEKKILKIAELIKKEGISEIVTHGGKKEILIEGKKKEVITFNTDFDAKSASVLLGYFANKEIFNDFSKTSIVSMGDKGETPTNGVSRVGENIKKMEIGENKGVKIILDVGGTWLEVVENGNSTIVHIDHHGTGRGEPTSATKMVYEILDKAGLLKEKSEWLEKYVNFVNEVDNVTYLEKKEKNGENSFTENYFRNEWPRSLYALAEREIPFNILFELCKSGKIKDPSIPFTQAELDGEIGTIKIGDSTIKELCAKKQQEVSSTLENGIKNAIKFDTKSLGKVIYHNFLRKKNAKGKEFGKPNTIPNHLAIKATIAKKYDTYASWNKLNGKFHVNSFNPNLSYIAEKLNEADPGCALDVRGVMISGTIKNLTEEKFLEILKNTETKPSSEKTEPIQVEMKPERTLGPARPELEKETEGWTKEDQETLDTLLTLIESTK